MPPPRSGKHIIIRALYPELYITYAVIGKYIEYFFVYAVRAGGYPDPRSHALIYVFPRRSKQAFHACPRDSRKAPAEEGDPAFAPGAARNAFQQRFQRVQLAGVILADTVPGDLFLRAENTSVRAAGKRNEKRYVAVFTHPAHPGRQAPRARLPVPPRAWNALCRSPTGWNSGTPHSRRYGRAAGPPRSPAYM